MRAIILKLSRQRRPTRTLLESSVSDLTDDEIKELILSHSERIKRVYRAKQLSQDLISLAIKESAFLPELFLYQRLSQDNIKLAINTLNTKDYNSFRTLYESQVLSDENIKLAIDKGCALNILFDEQDFSDSMIEYIVKQADRHKDVNQELGRLYKRYQLKPDLITYILAHHLSLENLFTYQKLTHEQIKLAIKNYADAEYELFPLVVHVKLTEEEIDLAIDSLHAYLHHIYEHQDLTLNNIKHALIKNKEHPSEMCTKALQKYQIRKLTPKERKEIRDFQAYLSL